MILINEEIFNLLHEEIPLRLAIVKNETIEETLYVLMEEKESFDINPNDIKDFIRRSYVSKFDNWEFSVTYYTKTTKTLTNE